MTIWSKLFNIGHQSMLSYLSSPCSVLPLTLTWQTSTNGMSANLDGNPPMSTSETISTHKVENSLNPPKKTNNLFFWQLQKKAYRVKHQHPPQKLDGHEADSHVGWGPPLLVRAWGTLPAWDPVGWVAGWEPPGARKPTLESRLKSITRNNKIKIVGLDLLDPLLNHPMKDMHPPNLA